MKEEIDLGSLCLQVPFCVSENIYSFQRERPLPALTFHASCLPWRMKAGSLQALSESEVMAMVKRLGSNFT